jgi:ribosome maturation factor RimP
MGHERKDERWVYPPFLLEKRLLIRMFVELSSKEAQILAMLEAPLRDAGYAVVRIKYHSGMHSMLQFMLDRTDETPLTIGDCEVATKIISTLMDVEDPIEEAYRLEVGSAGMDRPLTSREDFVRFIGYEARITSRHLIDGSKRFKGTIQSVSEDAVTVLRPEMQPPESAIPFTAISDAKLQITDELIDYYQENAPQAEEE